MRPRMVTLPELGLIAGTRALLGAGVGLLLADRLDPGQRRAVGWTLLAVWGMRCTPKRSAVAPAPPGEGLSMPIQVFSGCSARKGRTTAGSSCVIAMKTTGSSLHSAATALMCPKAATQGPHHVPQN